MITPNARVHPLSCNGGCAALATDSIDHVRHFHINMLASLVEGFPFTIFTSGPNIFSAATISARVIIGQLGSRFYSTIFMFAFVLGWSADDLLNLTGHRSTEVSTVGILRSIISYRVDQHCHVAVTDFLPGSFSSSLPLVSR